MGVDSQPWLEVLAAAAVVVALVRQALRGKAMQAVLGYLALVALVGVAHHKSAVTAQLKTQLSQKAETVLLGSTVLPTQAVVGVAGTVTVVFQQQEVLEAVVLHKVVQPR